MRSVKSTLKKIKGDASFRSFYRKKNNKKNSIIVYASKEKEKNLLIYDAINSLLIENKILAPKLYKENYKQNSIEIEDFGDDTIFKLLKKNGSNKINLYKKSIDLLSKIQKIKQNKIKNFNGKNYKIPIYENNKLNVFPTSIVNGISVNYIRKPLNPMWSFTAGTGAYVYNNLASTNFELHPAEQTELITRILLYAGVVIQSQEIIQVAASQVQQQEINQKS